mgnify:CR=1 FL=1
MGCLWHCAGDMSLRTKYVLWLCLTGLFFTPSVTEAQIIIVPKTQRVQPRRMYGQYMSPRQYMRRLGPNTPQPTAPPRQPAPAQTPAQAGNASGIKNSPAVAPQPVPPPLGVPKIDPEKERQRKEAALKNSIEFLKKRAEAGSPSAQYELGKRYMTGDGVEKDFALARKWLEASAKQGEENAKLKLSELDKLEGGR